MSGANEPREPPSRSALRRPRRSGDHGAPASERAGEFEGRSPSDRQVAREGGHLKLCGVSARTDELLRAANIDSVVPSYSSELAALESF
jgi:hypothetical protein